jgi:hypothetical protein
LTEPWQQGWANPLMISALTGLRRVWAVCTYVNRLQHWGLVERWKPPGGPIMWSISLRGRKRLAWVNRTEIQSFDAPDSPLSGQL